MSAPILTTDPQPAQSSLLNRARALFNGYRQSLFDVIVLMIPDGISLATATVTSVLLTRGLGPTKLGAYALVQSIMAIATSLSNLGIGAVAIRYAAMAYSQGDIETQLAVLRWTFRLRMFLLLCVTGALFLLAPFLANNVWHIPTLIFPLRLGLLGAVFSALEVIPTIYFQSMRQFTKNTVIAVGENLVTTAGIVYIHFTHQWAVETVLITTLLTAALGTLLFVGMAPRAAFIPDAWWRSRELWGRDFWKGPGTVRSVETGGVTMNTFAFYNFLTTLVTMVASRMDVWLMGRYLRTDQLGIYSAATRFMVPLQVLSSGVNNAVTPRASGCRTISDTVRLLRSVMGVGAIVLVGCLSYSMIVPSLAPIAFGSAYSQSASLGRYLAVGQTIALLMAPIGIIGYNLGLVKHYCVTNVIQLIGVLVVLCIGLPRIGVTAAAWAFIVNAGLGALMNGYLIYRRSTTKSLVGS